MILYRIPAVHPELMVLVPDTGSPAAGSYAVRGLEPGTTYEFAVARARPRRRV